jgi:hypothetical protein
MTVEATPNHDQSPEQRYAAILHDIEVTEQAHESALLGYGAYLAQMLRLGARRIDANPRARSRNAAEALETFIEGDEYREQAEKGRDGWYVQEAGPTFTVRPEVYNGMVNDFKTSGVPVFSDFIAQRTIRPPRAQRIYVSDYERMRNELAAAPEPLKALAGVLQTQRTAFRDIQKVLDPLTRSGATPIIEEGKEQDYWRLKLITPDQDRASFAYASGYSLAMEHEALRLIGEAYGPGLPESDRTEVLHLWKALVYVQTSTLLPTQAKELLAERARLMGALVDGKFAQVRDELHTMVGTYPQVFGQKTYARLGISQAEAVRTAVIRRVQHDQNSLERRRFHYAVRNTRLAGNAIPGLRAFAETNIGKTVRAYGVPSVLSPVGNDAVGRYVILGVEDKPVGGSVPEGEEDTRERIPVLVLSPHDNQDIIIRTDLTAIDTRELIHG